MPGSRHSYDELLIQQKLELTKLFAGGIAHDFNNLLNAILGNVSLAKLFASPHDKCYKHLDATENACLQARDFTQQLLSISRGETPNRKIFSVAELLKKSEFFVPPGTNVKCVFDIPGTLGAIEVDEGQFDQATRYLVMNACKAMPAGGVLTISAENVEIAAINPQNLPAGKFLRISFHDQGPEIPKEHFCSIFDPYFHNKRKGSGLFLTIAYLIIKKHDGTITVDSEIGKGSSFIVYLPASDEPVPVVKTPGEAMTEKSGQGRVLIMDDEEIVREIAIEMLDFIGFESAAAGDGREAIELYVNAKEEGRPFDALLMDLNIAGGMGGKEAISRLKTIDPDVKAVVSSGYANDPIMTNFKEYGFYGAVPKPYKIQELSTAFSRILREKNQIDTKDRL